MEKQMVVVLRIEGTIAVFFLKWFEKQQEFYLICNEKLNASPNEAAPEPYYGTEAKICNILEKLKGFRSRHTAIC